MAAIEHLPRSHEAQEHMRRRVNEMKEEAETTNRRAVSFTRYPDPEQYDALRAFFVVRKYCRQKARGKRRSECSTRSADGRRPSAESTLQWGI